MDDEGPWHSRRFGSTLVNMGWNFYTFGRPLRALCRRDTVRSPAPIVTGSKSRSLDIYFYHERAALDDANVAPDDLWRYSRRGEGGGQVSWKRGGYTEFASRHIRWARQ